VWWDTPTIRPMMKELFGKTACHPKNGVNPYVIPTRPGPRVGEAWNCYFYTSVCPNPPAPDDPVWLIVSQQELPEPIDFTPYGMPGCWLMVSLENVIFVPPGRVETGLLTRDEGSGMIHLHWTPQSGMAGRKVWMQMLVARGNEFVASHAVRVTVGSG
jgi:hypothetical protein